jgi:predicted SAM-dependent methyltransferase
MVIGQKLRKLKSAFKKAELRWLSKRPVIKLVVGASKIKYPGWILTEIDFLNILRDEDWAYSFKTNSIDAILAEHVWEHLTRAEGLTGAKNCFKYLKPGGYLRIAVPDGNHPDKNYIDYVKPGGTGAGADDHKELYTFNTLKKMLEEAGFQVKPLEWFDDKGEFHFESWDPEDGMITRSSRFDERNARGELKYTSLIIDACKK